MSDAPSSSENLFAEALKAKTETAPAAPEVVAPEPELQTPSELDMLKSRARVMGISHSPNIGVEALKAKISDKLKSDDADAQASNQEPEPEPEPDVPEDPSLTSEPADVPTTSPSRSAYGAGTKSAPNVKKTLRQQQYEEQMKLVRLRITNLNPAKKDLPGEIFTVANKILGAVRKFVPYGEATENGFHVPFFIYTQLREREFLLIKSTKDSRGRQVVSTSMAREFALEVLPPLTERELARLAASQAAAKGME